MCNFTSARYEDLVFYNDQNDWIVVSKKKKKTKKGKHKTSALNGSYRNDHPKSYPRVKGKKPLNRKDRRRQQQQKEVSETIYIPDVPGHSELDLFAEVLKSLKNIPVRMVRVPYSNIKKE
jgi:hypothetical protein